MKEVRSALKGIYGPLRSSRDVAAIYSLSGSAVVWFIDYAPVAQLRQVFQAQGLS